MALEGTIKEFGLADIFQLIGLQKKTGILFLKGTEETVNVHFEDGMVVKVDEGQKRHKYLLGRILLNRGKINESRLKEALEIQKSTGQKLGGVLISQGLINKDDLRDALSFQINEAVYKVFRWKGGDYKFDQERVDFDRDTIRPLSTEHILMDGIRMLDEWPKVEERLPAMHVVLKQTERAFSEEDEDAGGDIFAGFSEGAKEGIPKDSEHILSIINGKRSVVEIIEMSMLGEFDTCKNIVDLMKKGMIATTSEKPELMTQELRVPELKAPSAAIIGGNIMAKAVHLFFVAALIIIFFQLTGPRKIMNPSETKLEKLKIPFATKTVKKVRNSIYGYFFDFGAYPENMSTLEQLDYIGKADLVDPWGSRINFSTDPGGNYAVTSPGNDGILGTEDDITSAL